MQKYELRREFFKLKNAGHSYVQCKRILKATYGPDIATRTLKRWVKKLNSGGWDLCDESRRPHTIHHKVTREMESEIVALRNKTGWGSEKIALQMPHLGISERTIDKILEKRDLLRKTKAKGKRIKWVRWQRQHPNSLWQIDHTDEMDKGGCYTLSIVDDCSRYSLALVQLNQVTTDVVTQILEKLIRIHGKPREILTDNGGAYGLNSTNSRFDRWCKKKGIRHIRTKVHSPQTSGKVERLFKTMDEELEFCSNDLELFRMRYNHYRPHCSLKGKKPAEVYFGFANLF
jgi:transposase InsO family protein